MFAYYIKNVMEVKTDKTDQNHINNLVDMHNSMQV